MNTHITNINEDRVKTYEKARKSIVDYLESEDKLRPDAADGDKMGVDAAWKVINQIKGKVV